MSTPARKPTEALPQACTSSRTCHEIRLMNGSLMELGLAAGNQPHAERDYAQMCETG